MLRVVDVIIRVFAGAFLIVSIPHLFNEIAKEVKETYGHH